MFPSSLPARLAALLLAAVLVALAAAPARAAARPELLLYCGITMVRPMTEIAHAFEKRENVRITIAQGGSEDLYQSARRSGVGDLYLPGEPSYRRLHLADGLLGDYVVVGFNQMALLVRKGNPQRVRPDLREVLRKDLMVILGNADSGSVGKEARDMLEQAGLYAQAVRHAAFLAPDSRSLVNALKRGDADLALGWRATAFFPDNVEAVEVIDLDPALAQPQALLLNLLTHSRHPDLARRFMAFAAGEEGQAIFRRHGFLDNKTPAATTY